MSFHVSSGSRLRGSDASPPGRFSGSGSSLGCASGTLSGVTVGVFVGGSGVFDGGSGVFDGVTVGGSGVFDGITVGGSGVFDGVTVGGSGVTVGVGAVVGLCGFSLGCVEVEGAVVLVLEVLPVSLALPLWDGWG